MSIYLRNLITEDERRRISNLHNSRIKSEFRKLLSEQDPNLVQRNDPDLSPELNKFNEGAFDLEDFIKTVKQQVEGFPEDGSVVHLDGHGFVYEVRKDNPDGTVDAKYYLKQDGSVVGPDMKTIAKNKWYTTPIQVEWPTKTAVSSGPTVPTGTQQGGQEDVPTQPLSRKEMRQQIKTGYKERKATAAATEKEKQNKINTLNNEISNLTKTIKQYQNGIKKYGPKDKGGNGQASVEQLKGYESAIKQYTNDIKLKQAEIAKINGTGATGTGATGTGAQGATTNTTQGRTTRSREDQEMIDQGLGQ